MSAVFLIYAIAAGLVGVLFALAALAAKPKVSIGTAVGFGLVFGALWPLALLSLVAVALKKD